ncbi:unnamed protein product [Gongylonema pulchrum]|uniref:DUF1754-domain-containing protein n=1 Tax=Gongylonema pulchrum TaxID=637853 RepID=A0A183E9E9_9BILA|nr:unnamed protein product [Gongylonema pulchrum]
MDSFGGRSRFSCLKIDDDTDSSGDDDRESESKGKAQQLSQKKVRGNQKEEKKASTGGLIVHPVVQKQKNKSKKKKKKKVRGNQKEEKKAVTGGLIVHSGGLIVHPVAQKQKNKSKKKKKDLQTALELSREMAISAASPSQETSLEMAMKSNKEKEQRGAESDSAELLTADIDKEASNLFTKTGGSTTSRERQLVALYRTKLLEVLRQQKLDNDIRKKAEEEMTKYRSRYKKLCQLLNDAEGSLTVACLFS